jgi:hypothetical protein
MATARGTGSKESVLVVWRHWRVRLYAILAAAVLAVGLVVAVAHVGGHRQAGGSARTANVTSVGALVITNSGTSPSGSKSAAGTKALTPTPAPSSAAPGTSSRPSASPHAANAPSPRPTPSRSSASPRPSPSASNPAPAPTHSNPPPAANSNCSGASDTPDGADPHGGCWPGPDNTGVPAGVTLTRYTGSCSLEHATNRVIRDKIINCWLLIYSPHVTIKDSVINGGVGTNSGNASVTVEDSEINGGSSDNQDVGWDNITVIGSNLYGNQHSVQCENNCLVEDSWLHNQYNRGSSGHQNGFLSTGGRGVVLRHNSVGCTGGCTADISFLNSSTDASITVQDNLLLASPDAAFCAYPGPNAQPSRAPVNDVVWSDNVFQHGANGKCATYGPVYGWYPSVGYGNVWSGNTWNGGRVIRE